MNIHDILVTLETFHEDMSWLKACALSNICIMFPTFEVSQAPMFSLNARQPANMYDMSLTDDVSQLFWEQWDIIIERIPLLLGWSRDDCSF